ncbi:hypothetical protein [Actinopolyspora halophila]|uniref:hypothetical protein n=1 Tax=Actinopolyspora halophila TaxID=1850 RepID=UPI000363F5D4|nr:hypothetical protein [Actinopolyspora halophila]
MLRKAGLFVVMLGALSLSFSGQVETVSPLLGQHLAVVFAATNDVAALLALNEVTSSGPGSIRRWAWSVLFLSGGTVLGLNTWHALQAALLPDPASVAVGAGPVVLAWLLSHLVALVLSAQRQAGSTQDSTSENASESAPATSESVPETSAAESAETEPKEAAREAVGSGTDGVSVPAQPEPAPLGSVASQQDEQPSGVGVSEALPVSSETVSDTDAQAAASLPMQLIDQAEKFERQELQRSGGKRGLSYREAPRRLGVRYSTAREALKAARQRMAAEEENVPGVGSPVAAA